MKLTLGLIVCALAALLAWMWWGYVPSVPSLGPAAGQGVLDQAPVLDPSSTEQTDARRVVRGSELESVDPTLARRLKLELLRFPDEAAIANTQIEAGPVAGVSGASWLVTDAQGRLAVEVPGGTTALHLGATGFEICELPFEASQPNVRAVLTPSTGLFGRVVDEAKSPVAGARVTLELTSHSLMYSVRATRAHAEVGVAERRSIADSVKTSANGFYFIPYATTASVERVRLVATKEPKGGALGVDLPRATGQLEDLSLTSGQSLTVRVLDVKGQPVAGARILSPENPRPQNEALTGADGTLTYFAPSLPAGFSAFAPSMIPQGQLFDGQAVAPTVKVESTGTRVELVLESVPSVKVRVLDAETRLPINFAQGRVQLLGKDRPREGADINFDSHGEAVVMLVTREPEPDPEAKFLAAKISVFANDYSEGDPPKEIDLRGPLSEEPIEFLLKPIAGTAALHGRVLRAGAPVADLQVGVKVQLRSEGASPRGWEYKRCWTDAEGRFVARWQRKHGDQVVCAFPHKFRPDEYGFIGPMDLDLACANEQVLELKAAMAVPALLRGVVKGGRYCYYVSIVDGTVEVGTTTNGNALAVDTEGEGRVVLLLPSDRRSRVSVGYMTDNTVIDNHEKAIDFDPERPGLLVFDLSPTFASISGSAVGFSAEELPRLSVAFVASSSQQARLVPCRADGTFQLVGVPLGDGDLLLLLAGDSQRSSVIARLPQSLQGNLENIQLRRDPESLPEAAAGNR
ncbi:MAG: carboxypeptidase-like regulatory domain-containing protein [Planctomycetota bacterium]